MMDIKKAQNFAFKTLASDWDDFDDKLANLIKEGWEVFGVDVDYGDCYNFYLRREYSKPTYDYAIVTGGLADGDIEQLTAMCANGWYIIHHDTNYEEFWLSRVKESTNDD